MRTYDAIVVGGASAGLTASLYTARQSLKTLVITKDIGGQALLTDRIENYPGFDHISGFDLLSGFESQAKPYGSQGDAQVRRRLTTLVHCLTTKESADSVKR